MVFGGLWAAFRAALEVVPIVLFFAAAFVSVAFEIARNARIGDYASAAGLVCSEVVVVCAFGYVVVACAFGYFLGLADGYCEMAERRLRPNDTLAVNKFLTALLGGQLPKPADDIQDDSPVEALAAEAALSKAKRRN